MQNNNPWIEPDWTAPKHVRAFSTLRFGGVSTKPFDSFNLANHVGDDPAAVLENRKILRTLAKLSQEPSWITQVHGIDVIDLDDYLAASKNKNSNEYLQQSESSLLQVQVPIADASISFKTNQIAVVLTGDCLPILLCDRKGSRVAAIHAGWRGLAQGIIKATVDRLDCDPKELLVWLGPAIGPQVYEVGQDFKDAFAMDGDDKAFQAIANNKWLADLYTLARLRLQHLDINATQIYGGKHCTFTEEDKFFSSRQSNPTGRQATLIWLT